MSRIDDRLAKTGDEWRAQVDADYAQLRWRPSEGRHRVRLLSGAVLVAALIVAAVGALVVGNHDGSPTAPDPDAAACAGPVLKVSGPIPAGHLARNEPVTITGRYYVAGCQDGGGDVGPLPPVGVVLVSAGGQKSSLGRGTPSGEMGTFTIRAVVPADFATGPAVVSDGGFAKDVAVTID